MPGLEKLPWLCMMQMSPLNHLIAKTLLQLFVLLFMGRLLDDVRSQMSMSSYQTLDFCEKSLVNITFLANIVQFGQCHNS
jgi:hypothetical protein